MKSRTTLKTCALALAATAMLIGSAAHAQTPPKKYKVYLSMSYSGNGYQTETSNLIKALAATPPYDKLVDLKTVISGTDVQAQAAAYQSMVSAGADAIITFPISATGLNRAIHEACEKHVLVYTYSGTVTEPCARTVSYITAGFAPNTAQWLVNKLNGKGNVFIDRGRGGQLRRQDELRRRDERVQEVSQHQDRGRVLRHVEQPDHAAGNREGARGSPGCGRDLRRKRRGRHCRRDACERPEEARAGHGREYQWLPSRTGERRSETARPRRYFIRGPDQRLRLRVQADDGRADRKRKVAVHNIEYPLPWVPADKVKVCTGDTFVNGCNAFPSTRVPDSFNTEVFDPVLTPELSLNSALNGTPTPGATIHPLPADIIKEAPNVPGVNCQHCEAPADLFKLTKVSATVKP